MKQLLENWKKHLKYLKRHAYMEPHGLQEEENDNVVTFDFDDTLSLSHFDREKDDWVHDGPHLPMIGKFNKYKDLGYKVFIVTTRHQEYKDDQGWYTLYPKTSNNKEGKKYFSPDQRAVEQFIEEYNLEPDGIFFTNGDLKVKTLLKLRSSVHHDDDLEEIEAAKEADIKTVISEPYKNLNVYGEPLTEENTTPQDTNKVSKVVIFNDSNKVLILKRSDGKKNWDLPGGHIHSNETFTAGGKRETEEETGLKVTSLKPIERYRNVSMYQAKKPKGSIKLQPEEHIDYKWVNPSDIDNYNMRKYLKNAIFRTISTNEQTEPFQKAVKKNYRKMKLRLIATGPNTYNIGGKMKKPPYSRSKSAPPGFGGSLEE